MQAHANKNVESMADQMWNRMINTFKVMAEPRLKESKYLSMYKVTEHGIIVDILSVLNYGKCGSLPSYDSQWKALIYCELITGSTVTRVNKSMLSLFFVAFFLWFVLLI